MTPEQRQLLAQLSNDLRGSVKYLRTYTPVDNEENKEFANEYECCVNALDAVLNEIDCHQRQLHEYEQNYILPCFKWAEGIGFDLHKAVHDNPGKNCVQLLVERLISMRVSP